MRKRVLKKRVRVLESRVKHLERLLSPRRHHIQDLFDEVNRIEKRFRDAAQKIGEHVHN